MNPFLTLSPPTAPLVLTSRLLAPNRLAAPVAETNVCACLSAQAKTPSIRVAKGYCNCLSTGDRFAQRGSSVRFLTFGVVTPVSPPVSWTHKGQSLKAAKAQLSEKVCLVVGIGASAGGLEALTQMLTHLPTTAGMAYVLVQHLDPITRACWWTCLGTILPCR